MYLLPTESQPSASQKSEIDRRVGYFDTTLPDFCIGRNGCDRDKSSIQMHIVRDHSGWEELRQSWESAVPRFSELTWCLYIVKKTAREGASLASLTSTDKQFHSDRSHWAPKRCDTNAGARSTGGTTNAIKCVERAATVVYLRVLRSQSSCTYAPPPA